MDGKRIIWAFETSKTLLCTVVCAAQNAAGKHNYRTHRICAVLVYEKLLQTRAHTVHSEDFCVLTRLITKIALKNGVTKNSDKYRKHNVIANIRCQLQLFPVGPKNAQKTSSLTVWQNALELSTANRKNIQSQVGQSANNAEVTSPLKS